MRNDILISTTPQIENCPIKQYKGLVSTNVVLGTNFFSDFSASFTDFFGGTSETYQRKQELMYNTAIENLKTEAQKINANAIVGVKIDFDEISGKGKSMFMLSAVGTAVVIDTNKSTDNDKPEYVPSNILKIKITQIEILRDLTPNISLSETQWEFLFENPVNEIADVLIPQFQDKYHADAYDQYCANIKAYFKVIDRGYAEKLLYSKITEFPRAVVAIMRNAELFSPQYTYDLLMNGNREAALESLTANKSLYDRNDLAVMQKILSILKEDNSKKGRIEKKKSGLLSKEKEIFVCYLGHENSIEDEFCKTCGVNIAGQSRQEKNIIDKLTNQIGALKQIMA